MVLTYNLLEDRHVADINFTNISPLYVFKMVERYESLDNILCDQANENVEKCLVEVENR